MQVILEVAPDTLYTELITKVFKGSLYEMSTHYCGNFIVQALIAQARSEDHVSDLKVSSIFFMLVNTCLNLETLTRMGV